MKIGKQFDLFYSILVLFRPFYLGISFGKFIFSLLFLPNKKKKIQFSFVHFQFFSVLFYF